jgi:Ca2+-binding RTX toxin-like protein
MAGTDTIAFGSGVVAQHLLLTVGKLADPANPASFHAPLAGETGLDLRIEVRDPATNAISGSVTIVDFANSVNVNDKIRYANGTEVTLLSLVPGVPVTINGTANGDEIEGTSAKENINGLAGDDELFGGGGNDVIDGGAGEDYIDGGTGNDVIRGGTGDDWLEDYGGNDQYKFAAGDGFDVIFESDEDGPSTSDQLNFEGGIDPTDLWFARYDNDLVIARLGSYDGVVMLEWFSSPSQQIEAITADNGAKVLHAGDVNSLISQMAAFAAQVGEDPSAVQPSNLPPEYQVAVNAVWQSS